MVCPPCPFAVEQQNVVPIVHAAGRGVATKWSPALVFTSIQGMLAMSIAEIPCLHERNHRIINNKAVRTGLW